ncbi:MAG: oxidoreductase [Actinomycetota bacterium]|nr:oxidoreductase [Actinomycetota bacterium]
MTRPRIATVWLGGCSGCHMSFLDLDEWLFDLVAVADVVHSPIMDVKEFPDDVDVTLVEGAVANADNLEVAKQVRARSRLVISFGDCAVGGNVTAMRNPLGDPSSILEEVYVRAPDRDGQLPAAPGIVPPLLERVLPLHRVIDVDAYLPGCPPPAERIRAAIEALLRGEAPPSTGEAIRFG